MTSGISKQPTPFLGTIRSAITDSDGTMTYAGQKLFTDWDTRLSNGLNQLGNLIGNVSASAQVVGKPGNFGTILQNIDQNGLVTGNGVDFAEPYLHKDTDHIADGTGSPLAGGKAAYLALVANVPIANGLLEWDGSAWHWIPRPQTIAAVASNWLRSFDQATGLFTKSQPAFSDISGTAATTQIGTGTPLAGEYVDGGTGAWTAIPSPGNLAVNPQTISYIALPADQIIQMNAAGATAVTLPVAGISTGKVYWVKNIGAGTCTVSAASGNIDANATIAITQWQAYQFYWDGSTWHQLSQSLSP